MLGSMNVGCTIIAEDWLNAPAALNGERVDFLYADPPFNTGQTKRTPPNAAKAGQTIPIKWRLTNAIGTPISNPSSFVSITSSPTSGSCSGTPDAIETYTGSSGLQYLGDGNWQFNWKIPKSYAGLSAR